MSSLTEGSELSPTASNIGQHEHDEHNNKYRAFSLRALYGQLAASDAYPMHSSCRIPSQRQSAAMLQCCTDTAEMLQRCPTPACMERFQYQTHLT